METILYNISQVLGVSILHSLWQGLIVYILLRIVLAAIPSLSSIKKYNLAVAATLSITLWFAYTLISEISVYNWVNLKSAPLSALLPYLNLPVKTHYYGNIFYNLNKYMPAVCTFYFAGLSAKLMQLSWEWAKIRQIKRSLIPAVQMQQYINKFSKKLNITKHIQLKFSDLIDVPCMVGYFKPIILLPVSIATSLTACEVESILLHELSHIKRNDYLVNLLQQVITVMLFFNPFTQLINRIINQERENGCDDLVVEKTGKPLIYARALLKLEETNEVNLQLAMAAAGKKFYRIRLL
jgi:bla regulator protein BlaR1